MALGLAQLFKATMLGQADLSLFSFLYCGLMQTHAVQHDKVPRLAQWYLDKHCNSSCRVASSSSLWSESSF